MKKLIALCIILVISACLTASAQTSNDNTKTTQPKETKAAVTQQLNVSMNNNAVQNTQPTQQTKARPQPDPVKEKQKAEKLEWIRVNDPTLYKEIMEKREAKLNSIPPKQ
jgi:hypothetical protein